MKVYSALLKRTIEMPEDRAPSGTPEMSRMVKEFNRQLRLAELEDKTELERAALAHEVTALGEKVAQMEGALAAEKARADECERRYVEANNARIAAEAALAARPAPSAPIPLPAVERDDSKVLEKIDTLARAIGSMKPPVVVTPAQPKASGYSITVVERDGNGFGTKFKLTPT